MSDDHREEFVLVLEFGKIGRAGKIKTALGPACRQAGFVPSCLPTGRLG
jgi:hypothetical protein